jgi:alpha-ketoglutarate-dependent taurine dioxygenase
MTFEHIPSDYAILKMRVLPSSGGDTLWASGYETFDRMSRPYQKFLEGLTATHDNPSFVASSQRLGFAIHPGPRGAPENVGADLIAVHPIIRTNPVTGWKSLYSVLGQVQKINELSKQESDEVLAYLARLINENHDLQVRMKWGKDDVAIVSSSISFHPAVGKSFIPGGGIFADNRVLQWDNRCTYHTATVDFDGSKEVRTGNRAVSMGERPYLDPSSPSRREALGLM